MNRVILSMSRKKELWQFARNLLEKKMLDRSEEIKSGFADGGKYRKSFMTTMATLFEQLKQCQREGHKDALHYIAIYALGSSMLLDRAEIMITAHEKDFLYTV